MDVDAAAIIMGSENLIRSTLLLFIETAEFFVKVPVNIEIVLISAKPQNPFAVQIYIIFFVCVFFQDKRIKICISLSP
jgi:hypothetical protein